MRNTVLTRPASALGALLILSGCNGDEPDAYGNFEATEIVVSAEVGGQLIRFDVQEGDVLAAAAEVAAVDTIQLALQLQELLAQRAAGQAQTGQTEARSGALRAQLAGAEREYARIRTLYDDQAATEQQLEGARTQVAVLREEIRAAQRQTSGAQEQTGATEARMAQLRDRLNRSRVRNPIDGTVLTTYANAGEFVQPGQPLYRIANLDTLVLRAYLSGAQLAGLGVGQSVQVRVDGRAGEARSLPGRISWISASAEFTPTPIQTREERTDLVYAVRVRVANAGGALRIGMPGELIVAESESRQ